MLDANVAVTICRAKMRMKANKEVSALHTVIETKIAYHAEQLRLRRPRNLWMFEKPSNRVGEGRVAKRSSQLV
jgi:hypothetical protein